MDRKQMVERVVTVMLSEYIEEDLTPRAWDYMLAEKVLDAILPQITTVEELEALPAGSKVLDDNGDVWRCGSYWFFGTAHENRTASALPMPLTVVWRP